MLALPYTAEHSDRINAILRWECLNRELFYVVLEARVKTEAWRRRYNNRRPHSSLGFRTTVRFRDGVRVARLEQVRPSTHHRSREIEMQRWANKKADLDMRAESCTSLGARNC
jgi:hypothetical protein